jgi:rRNA maturation protein Nop10
VSVAQQGPETPSDSIGQPNECLWCGAQLADVAPGERPHYVMRCSHCGMGTTVPHPTPTELEGAYAVWYRPDAGRFSAGGDRILRSLRGRVARWVDGLSPPGPVLDVGCGDGAMLDALHLRGRQAAGLERKSNRPDVRSGTVADCEGGWAAIVFWHSLEHLPAPRQAVADASRRLAPGGVLVVTVPNFASLQARAFGNRWLHLDLPRHLSHLTGAGLVTACEEEGLEPLTVSYMRGGQVAFGWLHGLVGLLPGHPNLYQSVRRSTAREKGDSGSRWATLVSAAVLTPVALVAAGAEVALRRGGTVCVVARRPG